MSVFGERGKPEHPERKLSDPKLDPRMTAARVGKSNPGLIGVLSPLRRQPCSNPIIIIMVSTAD